MTTPSTLGSERLIESSVELDAAEVQWWNQFASIEDDFCWVQTPQIQKILRKNYLKAVIESVPTGGAIAEIGCGSGWLCILLAKLGAERVYGIDISAAQIDIAQRRSQEAKVEDRTDFAVLDASNLGSDVARYDVVVAHGFLHHLTVTEIGHVLRVIPAMLKPFGRFFVFEPVIMKEGHSSWFSRLLLRMLSSLKEILIRGQRLGLRKVSPAEKQVREVIGKRHVGINPRGPSPKEMPFPSGELDKLLNENFEIHRTRRCMATSHLVAQELLLLRLSHPLAARLLSSPMLYLARCVEKLLLARPDVPAGVWIFEMFECSLKPSP